MLGWIEELLGAESAQYERLASCSGQGTRETKLLGSRRRLGLAQGHRSVVRITRFHQDLDNRQQCCI